MFTKRQNADAAIIELIKRINPSVNIRKVTDELEILFDYTNLPTLNGVPGNFDIESGEHRITKGGKRPGN